MIGRPPVRDAGAFQDVAETAEILTTAIRQFIIRHREMAPQKKNNFIELINAMENAGSALYQQITIDESAVPDLLISVK